MLGRLTFRQLDGDEVLTVGFVDLVNRADIWVIERGCSESFPLEPFAGGRIISNSCGKNFNATWRCSLRSSASYTTPMPPPPSFSTMR